MSCPCVQRGTTGAACGGDRVRYEPQNVCFLVGLMRSNGEEVMAATGFCDRDHDHLTMHGATCEGGLKLQ